jgi:hypothetical protein
MKRSIIITSLLLAFSAMPGIVSATKSINDKSGGEGSNKAQAAGCLNPESSAVLDLNNVRTTIHSGGDMWWDLKQFARYEIPKDSRKHSLYLGTLWIGGTDINGQLKVAAQRYRNNGPDYYTGPLDTLGTAEIDAQRCKEFDRIWKITRAEAALHRFCKIGGNETNINCQGYITPESIKNWPAITYKPNDASLSGGLPSVQYFYAPFIDVDGDMNYDPEAGDYPAYDLDNAVDCQTDRTPYLYGDMTLYWIFNDKGNIHYETQSTPIGMEVRAQAFSFATNDEINNMTFYNYELINRGTTTLFNCYFGVNTDADLGYAYDDFVGCDVLRGFGYVYNGDAVDAQNNSPAPDQYGVNPPAVGIDFFEGPYADPDNIANVFDASDVNTWLAINGVGYKDDIVDNERIGMRRFVYYSNNSGVSGDPEVGKAIQYYNYLRGFWKNGARMVYGGNGFPGSPGATTTESDFMFPGDSDPIHWGTKGVDLGFQWTQINPGPGQPNGTAADQRFVQSAGPFTLLPGAVNDITTGAVWARAFNGDPFESVKLVRKADDKAQQLFENCFRLLDGPDAPDVYIQELDRELVLYWTNNAISNNYLNQYEELDYSIDTSVATTVESRKYRFQGYMVYQVKDATVSPDERYDLSKARLIAQCDLRDFDANGTAISTLVNYTPDQQLGFNVPQVMVEGANQGITQSLRVIEDAFATGADKRLVNHKKYHFLVIAYGYNNYKKYDQNDQSALDGQKKPFIASRKSATGAISIYGGIPHISAPEAGGTVLNSFYGDGPEITRLEGNGNGGNILDLTKESEDLILQPPYYLAEPTYQRAKGPLKIKVVDPLALKKGTYYVAIDGPVSISNSNTLYTMGVTSRWAVLDNNFDTIAVSDADLQIGSEQILFDRNTGEFTGLSVTIKQVSQPGENREQNNGFLEATLEIENPSNTYLGFIPDDDVTPALNWILSGNQTASSPADNNLDSDQIYERITIGQGGALAPYRMTSFGKDGPAWAGNIPPAVSKVDYIQSVDVVLTPDKSKWTRVPVFETDSFENFTYSHPDLAPTKARKLDLRRSPSVDKDGRYATEDGTATGKLLTDVSGNPDDANYIHNWGMGWFPGYAISVETGERLNMAFGESSYLASANGRDMLFNPTGVDPLNFDFSSILSEFGDAILGGKHFLYVFASNGNFGASFGATPRYDAGAYAMEILKKNNGRPVDNDKRQLIRSIMWTGIPLSIKGRPWLGEELRVRMRVTKPYMQNNTYSLETAATPLNGNKPFYRFSLDNLAPVTGDLATAKSALDLVNIVPNPYYAYSAYEVNQLDNRVKITNLPPECTITIYNSAGSLIRRYTKSDNRITSVDWDLKNFANIPIASGIYIVHIKAPGLGERVIKWFGVLRPTDVSDF